jgi:hypothetical protein
MILLKLIIGAVLIALSVVGNLWSLTLILTLPVSGFCLMAVCLMLFTVGVECLLGAYDLWRDAP